jgi:hypothetical protein
MIEQAKSSVCVCVCVCVCLAEKAKSSRPDMVHTCLDGMLSDRRSTEPSTSRRKNLSVRMLHTRSKKTEENMHTKKIFLTLASEHACINN